MARRTSQRWKGPTIEDVAKRAGVSIATVSRVLSQSSHRVNEATRMRVMRAVKELAYRPNGIARSLIQGQTATIGVLIPDIANPYYAQIVNGIEREALEAGYAVLLCNTDRREDKRRQYVALLQEMRIAAAIFAGDWVTAHELEVFREAGIPVATIGNRDVRGDVTVEVNNYGATRRLTEHLIAAGHRRIGFIGGPRESHSSRARHEGFRDALRAHSGTDEPVELGHGSWRVEDGYRLTSALLAKEGGMGITALIAANDLMALGALRALQEHGIRVPEEVSLAGHDDIPAASFSFPSLTSMRIPSEQLGRYAAAHLLRRVEEGGEAVRVILEAELIRRESTGPVPRV